MYVARLLCGFQAISSAAGQPFNPSCINNTTPAADQTICSLLDCVKILGTYGTLRFTKTVFTTASPESFIIKLSKLWLALSIIKMKLSFSIGPMYFSKRLV